ncbi:MAG: flippase-like domain-containing protein [Candidatus Diapherotrites archaeon]|nr:flippase-like domain-containing protein [Candidatus Diapherotrites archaeon]
MLGRKLAEVNVQKAFQKAIIALLFLIAFFAVLLKLSGSFQEIKNANLFLILLSSLSFILSALVWAFAWAFVLRKEHSLSYRNASFLGISSMFASFTPMQLGNDALRAFLLKEYFGVPLYKGIGASMVIKGIKFLTLAFFSLVALLSIPFQALGAALLLSFMVGLLVIAISAAILLLPISRRLNNKIRKFFMALSLKFKVFSSLDYLLSEYSYFLGDKIALLPKVFAFCIAAFTFEFLCFAFSAFSVGLYLEFSMLLLIFFAISLLERVPFAPRGFGLVETATYLFLSRSPFGFSQAKLVSFIAIFDFSRIILPTAVSLLAFAGLRRRCLFKQK